MNKYNKECLKAESKNKRLVKQNSVTTAKEPAISVLRKPCCYINNQNFKIKDNFIEFPVMADGKSKRLSVHTSMTDKQKIIFANTKLGTMRIVRKGNKIVIQIIYNAEEPKYCDDGNVMSVDLGIKCPTMSYISDSNIKFYGNGHKNKYVRRLYAYLCKKLQSDKKLKTVKRINDKEQRIMRDIDHKISHVIETATAHDVKVIKLEQLSNIRSATRTSRKNNHSLYNWSFYRFAQYIEYKAKLAGIKVEYINLDIQVKDVLFAVIYIMRMIETMYANVDFISIGICLMQSIFAA
ncbi:MAG: IS200/IS605 family element transposase accessory protein TnpB [Lachnospiraceae bacterium]|nr:IS200/IS605 family element transposase accessory protein TnpB [Lachnospiraceae bacterium]